MLPPFISRLFCYADDDAAEAASSHAADGASCHCHAAMLLPYAADADTREQPLLLLRQLYAGCRCRYAAASMLYAFAACAYAIVLRCALRAERLLRRFAAITLQMLFSVICAAAMPYAYVDADVSLRHGATLPVMLIRLLRAIRCFSRHSAFTPFIFSPIFAILFRCASPCFRRQDTSLPRARCCWPCRYFALPYATLRAIRRLPVVIFRY